MMQDEAGLDELARAIVSGTKVDWASTESRTADGSIRGVIHELAVIAAISDVHASLPLSQEPGGAGASAGAEPGSGTLAAWGAFRLLERVGQGAFGDVYRAWDTRLDREVALKLLPAGADDTTTGAGAFLQEGRLLARVRHPNVVTIYGAERIEDRIGLWMEFVNGRTLEQVLEVGRGFSEAEIIAVGRALCDAVSAVHGAGLLHRDIKAHNVMRSEDGHVTLMDFGAGRTIDDDSSPDLAGTPLYLAPEVLQGQPASVRSDLYSLGVLLYHLVTGSYPVQAATVREVRQAHERAERIAVDDARRDVSPKLARVINRAIDASPERRYASAATMGADMAALAPHPRAGRLAAAGVAATAALAVGLVWEAAGRQVNSSWTPSVMLGLVGSNRGATVPVSPAQPPVVAVLPFKNLSAGPDSDHFADGLTDEIIRNLASVQGLQVVSHTSSFAFKHVPHTLSHIGEQLGASLLVEGSVLRDGSRLRINARLVRVAGEAPLWTEQFDRQVEDVFSIQDEISRAIVSQLRLTLGDHVRQDTNLNAYDLYLRGQDLVGRRGVPNAQRAAELFERAIASDPAFAPAQAGLANAYAFMSFPYRGIAFDAAYPTMRPAAVKALQLNPMLAEAHAAMGWVYAYEHDWTNAEKSFRQALRLNPSLTQTYTSFSISTLQPLQKYDEALRLLQVASQHDPLSLDVQREIGEVQLFSGRYAEAVETLTAVRAVEPAFPFVQTYLARALILAGKVEEALPLWEQGAIWPVHAYVRLGRLAEARTIAAEHGRYPYRLAIIATALGETDRAAEAVERTAASEPHRIGRLLIEPELAGLRGHPRVIAIRKAFDLP